MTFFGAKRTESSRQKNRPEFVRERVMRAAFRERDRSVAIKSDIEEHNSMHTNIDIIR